MKTYTYVMSALLSVLKAREGAMAEAEAAAIIGVSARRFRSIFRATFGESFRAMRVRIRMEAARHRLLGTGESILSISTHLGYSDRDKLEKSFKAVFHVTPAKLREEIRKDNSKDDRSGHGQRDSPSLLCANVQENGSDVSG